MPGPRVVITVNGIMERSPGPEEHTAALVAVVHGGLIKPNNLSVIKTNDIAKRVWSASQCDSWMDPELE